MPFAISIYVGYWLDLDKIDPARFHRGYVPEGYFTNIQYTRDASFIFPFGFTGGQQIVNNERMLDFFRTHAREHRLEQAPAWIKKYGFLLSPGEIWPTHQVFRYDLFAKKPPMGTPPVFDGDYEDFEHGNYHRTEFLHPLQQVVLKIVNPKYGQEEFAKQRRLYDAGFPTPRVYQFRSSPYEDLKNFLAGLIQENPYSREKQWQWAWKFLDTCETGENPIEAFPTEKQRLLAILSRLDSSDGTGQDEFLRDLEDATEIDQLPEVRLKGFFTMEFWILSSFERHLFDILGGRKLETASGVLRFLDAPPLISAHELIEEVTKLLVRLWHDLGETHNDLKGEHVVFNWNTKGWGMIDFGELGTVGDPDSRGSPGKDLALFLKDCRDFIRQRLAFNTRFFKTYQKKWDDYSDPFAHAFSVMDPQAQKVEIWANEQHFWERFLLKIETRIGREILEEAVIVGRARRLDFDWDWVENLRG